MSTPTSKQNPKIIATQEYRSHSKPFRSPDLKMLKNLLRNTKKRKHKKNAEQDAPSGVGTRNPGREKMVQEYTMIWSKSCCFQSRPYIVLRERERKMKD
jgi:hypothetical protein